MRETVCHEFVQDTRCFDRVGMAEFGTAAENQTLAVGRHAVIGQDAPCVGEGAVFRAERGCNIGRQFLGRDNVGPDRYDTPFELRRHVTRIAICCDDHISGFDRAAWRIDHPVRP